jgi:acyl carrier protein
MKTKEEVLQFLYEQITEILHGWPIRSPYGPAHRLYDDLGLDSLDGVDLVIRVEDHYDIYIDDEQFFNYVETIGDLASLVVELLTPKETNQVTLNIRDPNAVVVAALKDARDQFQKYHDYHVAKQTPESLDKAVVNAKMVVQMNHALSVLGNKK